MVDVHTHVLFHIDDGPKTLDDSLEILKKQASDGVSDVVATSHFHPDHMPLEKFTDCRDKRLCSLRQAASEQNIPLRLHYGAEVRLGKLLFNLKSLSPLCFEGTSNLLCEISHTADDLSEVLQLIDRTMSSYNIQPVIAHVERYGFFYKKMQNLRYLHEMGCIIQVDTACFLGGLRDRMFAFKALKEGYIDIIASDCHNMTDRAPNLAEAYALIEKKCGKEAVTRLQENAAALVASSAS